MERYLGIDLGEKRVGLAVSDPTLTIAQPLKTIPYKKFKTLISDLKEVIKSYSISKIIVGLPITMKGTYSQKTHDTVAMVEKIQNVLSIPIEMFDERLTTVQAHQTIHQMGKKPSRVRDKVDQLAAVHLLQNYLDQERFRRIRNGT
jgi:putative Holliday junction resolvase